MKTNTLSHLVQEMAAAIREEQRAGWALGDAIRALGIAVKQRAGVAQALARVRWAEAKAAEMTATRERIYQEMLERTPSEVR